MVFILLTLFEMQFQNKLHIFFDIFYPLSDGVFRFMIRGFVFRPLSSSLFFVMFFN